VDIQLLLKNLIDRGDTVYLPVFAGKDKKMIYRKAENLTDLPPGEFTIPEPPETAEELGSQKVDIVLVPGRAFDRTGNRLGRGSGGYDTWLQWYKKRHPDTPLWGTCLQCQLINDVPVEIHDVPMNTIITAQEFIEL
jgi:5-formyltetrahydrofolate cyclo-ligase